MPGGEGHRRFEHGVVAQVQMEQRPAFGLALLAPAVFALHDWFDLAVRFQDRQAIVPRHHVHILARDPIVAHVTEIVQKEDRIADVKLHPQAFERLHGLKESVV